MNEYDELYHYGVKGMRWGVRRYKQEDGTLNAVGKRKYGVNTPKEWREKKREITKDKIKLNREASKKYKLRQHRFYAIREKKANDATDQLVKEVFGPSAYTKQSTQYRDKYEEQLGDARKYVDSKMKDRYGQAYSTWKSEKETKQMIVGGAAFVAALGIIAKGMHDSNKS